MKPRWNHEITIGPVRLLTLAIALAALAFAVVYSRAPAEVGLPLPATHVNVLPTTGEAGYNVEAFCADPLTTVARYLVQPPDSLFVANYTLDRTRDGVHETIEVGFYADGSASATHYDSANNDSGGHVSESARECIEERSG